MNCPVCGNAIFNLQYDIPDKYMSMDVKSIKVDRGIEANAYTIECTLYIETAKDKDIAYEDKNIVIDTSGNFVNNVSMRCNACKTLFSIENIVSNLSKFNIEKE